MKSLFMGILCVAASNAFAVSSGDIKAGYAELNRACSQSGVDRVGSSAAKECAAAYQRTETNNRQLDQEIANTSAQWDQDRQRVQQEEQWREQVRRRNGY